MYHGRCDIILIVIVCHSLKLDRMAMDAAIINIPIKADKGFGRWFIGINKILPTDISLKERGSDAAHVLTIILCEIRDGDGWKKDDAFPIALLSSQIDFKFLGIVWLKW
jgi:hypothetical protein